MALYLKIIVEVHAVDIFLLLLAGVLQIWVLDRTNYI